MDLRVDQELVAAGLARELVNRVQRLRKKAGLQATDAGELCLARCPPACLSAGCLPPVRLGAAPCASLAALPASPDPLPLRSPPPPFPPPKPCQPPPPCAVHAYIELQPAPAGGPDLAAALSSQAAYVQESLGTPIQPASQRPAGEEELGREEHELGGDEGRAQFTLVLTRPGGGGGGAAALAQQLGQAGL